MTAVLCVSLKSASPYPKPSSSRWVITRLSPFGIRNAPLRFPKVLHRPDRRRSHDVGLRLDRSGPSLDADGLEMYDGFFTSLEPAYLDRVADAIAAAGFAMPMLCCSPDFTNPDADARKRAVDREAELIARQPGGWAGRARSAGCSPASAIPRSSRGRGWNGSSSASTRSLAVAREHDIVLGLENHYKDGFWKYPEFAQKKDVFLELLEAIPDRDHFGVQYDPSNAIVAGDDPVALLRAVADRVVSMHASDRYLAEGATLDDLRQTDGTLGYSPEPAARRHRQGAQRLRRHLPHPGRARLPRLDQHRGRHERHGRDGRVAGVPAAHGPTVFPGLRPAMDRLRTALVGCGKVGQIHAQALATLPESEFVAVCDVDFERAEPFAGAVSACSRLTMSRQCLPSSRARGPLHRHAAPAARRRRRSRPRGRAHTCWSKSRWPRAWPIATR